MKFCNSFKSRRLCAGVSALALAGLVLAQPLRSCAASEERFDTPEEAVAALTSAANAKDTNAVHKIFGPEGHALVSPDVVQASEGFTRFTQHLAEKTEMVHESDSRIVLDIGKDGWPFPIPLVKEDGKWFFDVAAGKEEILNRRIGSDELGAIAVCQAYVEAQREYAMLDRDTNGILEYARHLRSTPGQHDGLYWPAKAPTDELSPFGPLITEAHDEGYRGHNGMMKEEDKQTPYHGYYFKILTRQGRHAPAGKYSYVVHGHMLGGFALIAWPAEWGNTGVMTFIVNQQGKVYQKNLGPRTVSIAKHLSVYDPDRSWAPAMGK